MHLLLLLLKIWTKLRTMHRLKTSRLGKISESQLRRLGLASNRTNLILVHFYHRWTLASKDRRRQYMACRKITRSDRPVLHQHACSGRILIVLCAASKTLKRTCIASLSRTSTRWRTSMSVIWAVRQALSRWQLTRNPKHMFFYNFCWEKNGLRKGFR